MGLQRFPFSDFRGGVNTRSGPFDLQTNEAQDALNVTLTQRGALQSRAGKTVLSTIAAKAQHIRPWYTAAGVKWLMASVDGDIYSIDGAGAATLRFNGTVGTVWDFEQAQDAAGADFLWCCNGTDAAQKWNGVSANTVAWAGTFPGAVATNPYMLRLWKNRMVVVGKNSQRLRFSKISDPETWASTDWADIKSTEDDIDSVSWLELMADNLVAFKRRSVWQVYDAASFANRRIGEPGCQDRFQSCEIEGVVYYFTRNGLYALKTNQGVPFPEEATENISNWFPENLNYSAIAAVRVYATRDQRVLVAVPTGVSADNTRLVEVITWMRTQERDTRRLGGPACMFHDLPVSALCTFRPGNVDFVVGAASNASKIHLMFNGVNDDGVAIDAYWKSGWQKFISEEPKERIRRLNIELTGHCSVEVFTDFKEVPSFQGEVLVEGDADPLWEGGTWEGGLWDPEVTVALERIRPETRGRYHCVQFRNSTLNSSFVIYAVEFVIRGGKEH